MKLTDILPLAKEEKREFYWSLVIEPGWIQAGIWSINEGAAQVVSISPGAAWAVDDDLVSAADTALSAAIQNLPEEFGEPTKTVFGLPNSWVSKGEIKEEHLAKIKKICSELSLTPTGFVVISEAIAHFIKSEEGAPASAVILGVGKETLEISVFQLGNLIGTSEVARSVSLAEDTIEGLARFASKEPFPSRFLIYDGKEGELEEAKQALLDANWDESEEIKFLHTPKVEVIKPDQKILATSLAGASEIGQVSKVLEISDETEEEKIKPEENITEPKEKVTPEELGFIVNEDISKKEPPLTPEPPRQVPAATEASAETPIPLRRRLTVPKFNLNKFLAILPKAPSFAGKNLLTLSISIAVIIIALFAAWWFLPTARVAIFVSPKTLEETLELTIDSTISSSDLDRGIVAGKILESEASGEKTISATGTKVVGDRATGVARIQNGLASPINLPAGTVILASNDLQFSTTEAASVSEALSPSSPGTANVDVVAANIGAEYNLAKDESFKVGNYPKADVDAVSVDNFTGGTSRPITAVSEEDQERLEEELTEELVLNAKESLSGEISSEEEFVESATTSTPTTKEFSHKIGDETENLRLALTISATGLTVNNKELFEYSKGILKDKIPEGYLLTEDELDIDFEVLEEDEGVYEVRARISASLLPDINKEEVAQKIKGKYPRLVENFLTSIPGFTRADIKTAPRLPAVLRTMPHVARRITIELESER